MLLTYQAITEFKIGNKGGNESCLSFTIANSILENELNEDNIISKAFYMKVQKKAAEAAA